MGIGIGVTTMPIMVSTHPSASMKNFFKYDPMIRGS
jgi:hypothetical protein